MAEPKTVEVDLLGRQANVFRKRPGLLAITLGNERLHALRVRGDAMDTDEVIAYALNAAAHAVPS